MLEAAGLDGDDPRRLLQVEGGAAIREYTVILEWDDDGSAYAAIVLALRGCASLGRTA